MKNNLKERFIPNSLSILATRNMFGSAQRVDLLVVILISLYIEFCTIRIKSNQFNSGRGLGAACNPID